MIGYTIAEIRRLLIKIASQQPSGSEHAWSWSRWRGDASIRHGNATTGSADLR
jgi:hypothetical protein